MQNTESTPTSLPIFLFKWIAQCGVFVAAAESANVARELLLSKVSKEEKRHTALQNALLEEPKVGENEPYVALAFFDDETDDSDATPVDQPAAAREIKLHLFRWNTDIGEFAAFAENAEAARALLMAKLPSHDLARDELAEAISTEPELVAEPYAVLGYH